MHQVAHRLHRFPGTLALVFTVLLAACGGGGGGESPTPTPAVDMSTQAATPTPHPFNVKESAMARISVTHMGKTVEYQKRGEDWVITDGEDIPVYDPEWQGTPLLLSFPRATLVSSTIDNLSSYGLDEPQTRVTIVTDAGVPTSYVFGDLTPDGFSRYVSSDRDDKLYSLDGIWCDVVSALATDPPYPP